MKKKFFFGVVMMVMTTLFLTSCRPAEKECTVDTDCVPATCCHPREAVPQEKAPNCRGILCTMECVPGTIDCEQGEIKCQEGECRAAMKR